MKTIAPTTKAAHDSRTARRGPNLSVRRPPNSRIAAPRAGSTMSSQAYAVPPVATWASPSCVANPAAYVLAELTTDVTRVPMGSRRSLQLQQVGVVDRGRPAGTEDRHDDGQTDDDLRRGHDHDEQGHDLPVEGAVHAGE